MAQTKGLTIINGLYRGFGAGTKSVRLPFQALLGVYPELMSLLFLATTASKLRQTHHTQRIH